LFCFKQACGQQLAALHLAIAATAAMQRMCDLHSHRLVLISSSPVFQISSATAAPYGSPTQAGFAVQPGSGSGLIGSLQLELELSGHGMEHVDTGAVLDVALSSDGVLGASVSNDMKAKVWDLDQQLCVQTLRGHTGWIVSVKVRMAVWWCCCSCTAEPFSWLE
jgi:WD40 repeat protein